MVAVLVALLAMASSASATARKQLYGVGMTPNWNTPGVLYVDAERQRAEVDAACAMRMNLIRFWVNWPDLEPQPGRFDPEIEARIDAVLREAAACRIKVLVGFGLTPAWAATDGRPGPSVPRPGTYQEAVAHIVARFPSVYALEIWNEPLNEGYWLGTPEQYAALVGEAVAGRGSSPVRLIVGALQGTAPGAVKFLNRLYDAGMHGQNGVSVHPYTFDDPADPDYPFQDVATKIRAAMLDHGDTSGVWITEFGFPVCPAQPCGSEADQAWNLTRSFNVAHRFPWIRGLTAFSIRDMQGWHVGANGVGPFWDQRCGLLDEYFHPRPVFYALRKTFKRWQHRKHPKHKRKKKK